MFQSKSAVASPGSAQASSTGLIVVGALAIAALAFGAYAAFVQKPAAANTSGLPLSPSSSDIEKRLTALEQRLAALEKTRAASATLASNARAGTEAPAASTQPIAANPSSPTPVHRSDTDAGPFDVVPNAELKGRLGRLIVEFPQGNDVKARTEAFKPGETRGLRTDFGNVAVEMTAGAYDLNIGGAMVANVLIKSGHDTRVHVGVLRLNATGNTRFELFPPGETKSLGTHFGQTDVGLPVGTFEVEVNGQRERVSIKSGSITEY